MRFLFFLLLLATPQAKANSCSIKGFEFIDAVLKAGQSVSVKKIDGDGDCSFLSPAVIASPARGSSGVTCQGKFFSDDLRGDWKLDRVVLTDVTASIIKPPAGSSKRLEIAFSFQVVGSQAKSLSIDTVILKSDTQKCSAWKSAF